MSTLPALQKVSHLQYILHYHPGTSHNVNYGFNFHSIHIQCRLGGFFISYTYKTNRPQGRKAGTGYVHNFTEEPVAIGIDHGFSLIKTRNHIFSNGVSKCSGKPPIVENSLCYNGSYYCVGGERKMVVTDKTADEDFFLLTLVAVAKELKTRGLHHNAVVILGAGVPFKRFGEEAGKLTAYLSRTGIHDFIFEEEEYSIAIEKVYCFPQCFAAVADRIANMEGRYVVADIGSWTKDIISIVDKRIDTEKSVTVPNSIITLFGEINDGVMQIGCGRILEEVLQDFIIGKEVVMPEKAQAVVISKLKEFAMEIEGLLGESGFDLDYCNVLYIGGGATIMKRFGEHKENVAYLEDIRLNAKGYELLASHQMKRG